MGGEADGREAGKGLEKSAIWETLKAMEHGSKAFTTEDTEKIEELY